jgi:hypothetical protein
MRHNESKLQKSCVQWFRYQYPNLVLFSIPNGIHTSETQARIAKEEGVTAGVADLFLMLGNSKYNGLFIEMKYGKGKQSEKQLWFENKCREKGYFYVICNDFYGFINTVNDYISMS